MYFDSQKFIKQRQESLELEHIELSKDEAIKLLVDTGRTKESAEFHIKISQIMQSYIRIGNKMVKVRKEK